MCGICGYVGAPGDVGQAVLSALKALEYRGYDSAGIATLEGGVLSRRRAQGKLKALESRLESAPLAGKIGIGHTRWATHGAPHEKNAHPHFSNGEVAIVHNGIIENHAELRRKLEGAGYRFETDTDTETIAHCIHYELKAGADLPQAVLRTVSRLQGDYDIGAVSSRAPAGREWSVAAVAGRRCRARGRRARARAPAVSAMDCSVPGPSGLDPTRTHRQDRPPLAVVTRTRHGAENLRMRVRLDGKVHARDRLQRAQRLRQHLGWVGIEAVGQHPHAHPPAQLMAGIAAGEFLQTGADPRAGDAERRNRGGDRQRRVLHRLRGYHPARRAQSHLGSYRRRKGSHLD